jgi:hypothetical protein
LRAATAATAFRVRSSCKISRISSKASDTQKDKLFADLWGGDLNRLPAQNRLPLFFSEFDHDCLLRTDGIKDSNDETRSLPKSRFPGNSFSRP